MASIFGIDQEEFCFIVGFYTIMAILVFLAGVLIGVGLAGMGVL